MSTDEADRWIVLLACADRDTVLRGIEGLTHAGPGAVEALLTASERGVLDHGDGHPRDTYENCAEALGALGRVDLAPLLQALRADRAPLQIVMALGLTGLGAVDALVEVLDHPLPVVRWGAVTSLESIGSKRAVEPLIRKLRDRSSDVRASAASALGKLGDARALEPLQRLAGRKGSAEAVFAAEAIARIQKREARKRKD